MIIIITLIIIHVCRLYLQITLLSDITNLKGDKLLMNSINGIREPHRPSSCDWPRQQHPNEHSWKLWKTILQQLYSSLTSQFIRSSLRLRRWNNCSTVLHRYLYSTLEQEIYQRDHSKITQWFASKIMHKHISIISSTNSACLSLPPDAYSILPINNTTFKVEPSSAIIPPSRDFCNDFADYIQSMPQ